MARTISFEAKQLADEQIRNLQKEISYDVKDFPIGFLVNEFSEDRFYIPEYQREFVWKDKNKCRFVESVILGIPIPFMFVREMDSGRYEIIDGAQRIQTIEAFMDDSFKLSKLDRLSSLNGFRFSDLPESHQLKFKNRSLRLIILEQSTTEEFRQEIFNRINTSGSKVNSAEVRRGAYKGEFMNFVTECATNAKFLELCKFSPELVARREPEELILRFLAYLENRHEFKHDVSDFLDSYLISNKDRKGTDDERKRFNDMVNFVGKYFPDGFAKRGRNQTPRVRFEAISLGVAEALKITPDLIPKDIGHWIESDEFIHEIATHSSNSPQRLNSRVDFVKNKLLG